MRKAEEGEFLRVLSEHVALPPNLDEVVHYADINA
jgi:hypothetical protein